MKQKEPIGRVWAGVIYPESTPEDWLSRLDSCHVPMAISPMHVPDNDEKKPHYHVLIKYEGNKTLSQVKEVFAEVNGAVLPTPVKSIGGYARYLCHLDDPKKQPLDVTDVICLGGFDYSKYIIRSAEADRQRLLTEIEDFVMDNVVTEYLQLRQYARDNAPEWLEILHNPSYVRVIDTLIRSVRHTLVPQS